jgi:hypothetical protein
MFKIQFRDYTKRYIREKGENEQNTMKINKKKEESRIEEEKYD